MVIIENIFIHFKRPAQWVYAGENHLEVFKKTGNRFQRTRRFDDISIASAEPHLFAPVLKELGSGDVGLILNSSPIIFNIFDFERIPWREKMRNDVVEWRLKKVFPENTDDYKHQYFLLNRKKVLSILIRNNLKNRIEELFAPHGAPLVYIGNSTVNIINRLAKLRKKPDFLVEADRNFLTLVFMERGLPYNIRKFRVDNESEAVSEIVKTLNYLKNNYAKSPSLFTVSALNSQLDTAAVAQELTAAGLRFKEIKHIDQMVFPG